MQENMEYSNEELVELIRSSAKDDQRDYLSMLYKQNYGIIHIICRRYSQGNADDLQDYEQEAYFALCKAVEHYDHGQGRSRILLR